MIAITALFLGVLRSTQRRSRHFVRSILFARCATILLTALFAGNFVYAQDPTGVSGDYSGLITTGGAYDAYNANAKRTVTDLVVPGSNGTYPLAFARTSNSRMNFPPGDTQYFGDCGNWRHSYQWIASGGNRDFTVGYPDGAVVEFSNYSWTDGSNNVYLKGPVGTSDQLEVSTNGVSLFLHMADGGIVTFEITNNHTYPSGGNPSYPYFAYSIADPYGATTKLAYATTVTATNTNPAGYLMTVTEPGGRTLNLQYNTVSSGGTAWIVLQTVTSSNDQSVTYNYPTSGTVSGNATFLGLSGVTYNKETNTSGGGALTAAYQYYYGINQANGKDDTGELPLLVTCDDPHYAGPMSRIYYCMNVANNSVWGVIWFEAWLPHDQSTQPIVVSDLSQSTVNSQLVSTITRGDCADNSQTAISRKINYGEGTVGPGGGTSTSAKPFQPTTNQDFEGNNTYIYYNSGGSGNGRGYVREIIDGNGYQTLYTTEPYAGKVTQVTLPDGRTRSTVWGSIADGTTTNSAGGCTLPFYVMQTTDERGQVTGYDRNAQGLVYQTDCPGGVHELYTYQAFNGYYKVSTYTSKLGAKFTYTYGSGNGGSGRSDLLVSIKRTYTGLNNTSYNETTYFYYDSLDRVNKVVDPGGVTDSYTYNGRHQITQVLHAADGTHIDYAYDNYGRQTSVSDELTEVTSTSYDDYGRPISVTAPVNAYGISTRTAQFVYDRRDNANHVIGQAYSHTSSQFSYKLLPSGRAEQHIYSPNGWMTDDYAGMSNGSASSPGFPAGQCIDEMGSIHHDALGHVLNYTDAQNEVWTSTYDNCGRLHETSDPLGHNTIWTYYGTGQNDSNNAPAAGLLQSIQSPGPDTQNAPNVTTTYTSYDVYGHLTGITTPYQGGNTQHTYSSTYDAIGDLTSQSDGANATGYVYDQLGRKIEVNYPDGTSHETWTYYPGGMVDVYTNRHGYGCTYQYDTRNRLQGKTWNDGATTPTSYVFDAAGHLKQVANNFAIIQYTPDASGGTFSESERVNGQSATMTTTYSQDADGNINGIEYPNGNGPNFGYDFLGRCCEMYSGSTIFSQYNYSDDCLTDVQRMNGIDTEYNYQYNGRVTDIWHFEGDMSGNHTGASVRFNTYGYAPNGNIAWAAREPESGQVSNPLNYGYGDFFYYYPDGTLSSAHHDFAYNGSWPNAFSPTADAWADSSQAIATGEAANYVNSYAYDGAGNRSQVTQLNPAQNIPYTATPDDEYNGSRYDGDYNTKDSAVGWTYVYDAENHMTSATGPGGQGATFTYDGLGRLITQNIAGVFTLFYYSGNQRVEERDPNNTLVYQYFFAAPGSDQILFRFDLSDRALYWYLTDLMGNTTHICDASGNVKEQYLYDAYGTPSFFDGNGDPIASTQFDNRYLWHGSSAYEWLSGPAMYYCRARFYLPEHGRFLQPDPIGQDGGLNIYAYCGNDPVNGSDPSGLSGAVDTGTPPVLDDGYGDTVSGPYLGGGSTPLPGSQYTPPSSAVPNTVVGSPLTTNSSDPAIGWSSIPGASAAQDPLADPHGTRNFLAGTVSGTFDEFFSLLRAFDYGINSGDTILSDSLHDFVSQAGSSLASDLGIDSNSKAFADGATGGPWIAGAATLPFGGAEEEVIGGLSRAAEGATGLADEIGILRSASQGKGNFGLGSANASDAMRLGRSWVGEGSTVASDGKTLISADGLRQFRPPSFKPNLSRVQANFEQRWQSSGQWQGNGHLDIFP